MMILNIQVKCQYNYCEVALIASVEKLGGNTSRESLVSDEPTRPGNHLTNDYGEPK